jgi:uncharacterized protein YdeI (YjbR/CyaY-like superfamily)
MTERRKRLERWARAAAAWANRLDASAINRPRSQTSPPAELETALASRQHASETWHALTSDEKAVLSGFVRAAKRARARSKRSDLVSDLCEAGTDRVRQWLANNAAIFRAAALSNPPTPPMVM